MQIKLSEDELEKYKSAFDHQCESQNDIFESEEWEVNEDDVVKKSVIIWSKAKFTDNDYHIIVEERSYLEDEDISDNPIDSFTVSLGNSKENLMILNEAINCFIENGGKLTDLYCYP